MNIKAKISKTVYAKDTFRTFGAVLVGDYGDNADIKLNKYKNFKLVGELNYLTEGKEYILNVEPEMGKYGLQYNVVSCPTMSELDFTNLSYDESYQILCGFTTDKQATTLLKSYPNFIQLVMEDKTSEIDVKKLHNIKKFRLDVYIREIKDKYRYYHFVVDNKKYGITFSDCKKLFAHFNTEANVNESLDKEPYYVLVDVLNKSFKQADFYITKCREDLFYSEHRTEYLMLWIIRENENTGSSKMNVKDMAVACNEYCKYLTPMLKDVAVNSERIYYDNATKYISDMGTYIAECNIAYFIKERLDKENIIKWDFDWKKYQHGDNMDLTAEQIELLHLICENNVVMLNGGAGMGKTASVSVMLDMLDDNCVSYMLLAPTGRASKVLKSSTNREAMTIHRGAMQGDIHAYSLILIDEMSMVSIEVLNMITSQMSKNQKIVFVGDEHQLPSIGAGNILKNLIDSKLIPVANLTKTFRYGKGGISTVATDIRNGNPHIDYNGEPIYLNNQSATDYKFININDAPLEQIMDEYKNLLTRYDKSDIMILSPFNIGAFGSHSINNAIQEEYNHNTDKIVTVNNGKQSIKFMVGDLVINTKNTYDALTYDKWEINQSVKDDDIEIDDEEGNFEQVNIMNGDCGSVKDIIDDFIIVDFDGDIIVYTNETKRNLLLSYAISVHRSQGGQCRAVMSITHPQHNKFLNRSLLYVANTRSQEYLVEIGSPSVIHTALDKIEMNNRNTWLLELLLNQRGDFYEVSN